MIKYKQITNISKFKKGSLPVLDYALIDSKQITVCSLGNKKFDDHVIYRIKHINEYS